MQRETVKDYLLRTDMQEAQAEALSHIFAEMATKNDLRLLQERMDQRFDAFDRRFEAREVGMSDRFETFEVHINDRFEAFEVHMNDRFEAFEVRINDRLQNSEETLRTEIAQVKGDLTWRLFAAVGLFATVVTLLDTFVT